MAVCKNYPHIFVRCRVEIARCCNRWKLSKCHKSGRKNTAHLEGSFTGLEVVSMVDNQQHPVGWKKHVCVYAPETLEPSARIWSLPGCLRQVACWHCCFCLLQVAAPSGHAAWAGRGRSHGLGLFAAANGVGAMKTGWPFVGNQQR